MRRLLSACALASVLSFACGDDPATTAATSATSTSTSSSSSSSSSSSTATTSPESTSSASDSATSDATSTSDTSTGSTGTTASTGSGTTAPDTTTTGSTTDVTTGSTSDGTTGGDLPFTCQDDSECVLLNDCCACAPVHVDEEQPPCDIQCLQPTCDAIGLAKAKAVCRFGRCAFEKITCNPLGVTCKALPPECEFGSVPSVVDDGNGKCWTGYCVPAEACDWVPECAYCGVDMTCVTKLQKGPYQVCEPKPVDCGEDPVTCACADIICESSPPHVVCKDLNDSLGCECPNC